MQKTILLIEDNQDVRENTAEILELANYKVLQAENGKIGVEIAQKTKPDLIICDIMMPVLRWLWCNSLTNQKSRNSYYSFHFPYCQIGTLRF
jgi:CheY-like chemotaxis protein